MKNWILILIASIFGYLTYSTIIGNVQKYIFFNGMLNEILFTIITVALCMCVLMLIDWKKLFKGLN